MVLELGSGDDSVKSNRPKSPRNRNKVLIGASSVVSLFGIGSTLASNITLNSGGVEFGQGVAKTVACDHNGFNITPVTYFDNTNKVFRIKHFRVTGLDLTPVGTGYSAGGYSTQADAIAAHPGEYYDGSNWQPTCDGVVLDFKLYTSSSGNPIYTSGYVTNLLTSGTSTSSDQLKTPLLWTQYLNSDGSYQEEGNSDAAIQISSTQHEDNYGSNVLTSDSSTSYYWATGIRPVNIVIPSDHPENSSFNIETNYDDNQSGTMLASEISAITVESMQSMPNSDSVYTNTTQGF